MGILFEVTDVRMIWLILATFVVAVFYCGFSGADSGYPPGDSPPERTSEY